jgi:GMP synthase (glutamine-hydrolysing)
MLAERRWIARWLADGRACLGLCLGAQLIAQSLGARVSRHAQGLLENGYTRIQPEAAGKALFAGPMHVFQWHNEGFELPSGCERLARGSRFENQAFRHAPHIIGLQFHPEVTPEIMYQWFCEGGHMLTDPGARDAEAQLRDARVFEPAIEAWTAGFLDQWIACSIEAQRKPMHNHA